MASIEFDDDFDAIQLCQNQAPRHRHFQGYGMKTLATLVAIMEKEQLLPIVWTLLESGTLVGNVEGPHGLREETFTDWAIALSQKFERREPSVDKFLPNGNHVLQGEWVSDEHRAVHISISAVIEDPHSGQLAAV